MKQKGQESSLATDQRSEEADWFIPTVGLLSPITSCFHRWDVRIKIVSLFSYSLLISLISQPKIALMALPFSFGAVFLAKISLQRTLRRLAAMSGFLGMLLLIIPFTSVQRPGDQLIFFTSLPFALNMRGLELAGTILLKAIAIAMIMDPLFNTAPLAKTVQGLRHLGVPAIICQLVLMAHRYIFVFLHEAKRMHMGMRTRGFRKRTDFETIKVLGHFIGMLIIRSIDRTERVYQAMLARGYTGTFPVATRFQAKISDWLFGMFWPAIALILVLVDSGTF